MYTSAMNTSSVDELLDFFTNTTRESPVDNHAQNRCIWFTRFIINSVLAGTICLLGFCGNTVSLVVLSRDKETPVASFLLQSLAFVDNIFLSLWFLHFSLRTFFVYMNLTRKLHMTWKYVRLSTYPLLFASQTMTIWLTVLIASSRYVAVCKPYRAARLVNVANMQIAVIAISFFSVCYNIPRFFESKFEAVAKNGTTGYRMVRTELAENRLYNMLYFDILYYVFSFFLPLLILSILTAKLTIAYRTIQRKRRAMRRRSSSAGNDNSITLVMIMVVLVFILCNAPARVVQIIWSYKNKHCPSVPYFFMEISSVMEVLNSSFNFVIYCVFRKKFRLILHQLCPSPNNSNRNELLHLPLNHLNRAGTSNGSIENESSL